MADPPTEVEDTFLTARQAEVLALRHGGLTQREIAERIGSTVANVSAIERAARGNVASARRTLELARVLEAVVRFSVPAGTDLRDLVDRIYARGDDAGVRIAYTDPELVTRLHDLLEGRLEGRALTTEAEVGITGDGAVVAYPSAEDDGGG